MAGKIIKFKIPLLLIVSIALAIMIGLYFKVVPQTLLGGSFCTLGITEPSFTSSNPYFNQAYYFLVSVGGCSQTITGVTGSTTIDKGLFTDFKPNQNFQISGVSVDQYCSYNIRNTTFNLKSLQRIYPAASCGTVGPEVCRNYQNLVACAKFQASACNLMIGQNEGAIYELDSYEKQYIINGTITVNGVSKSFSLDRLHPNVALDFVVAQLQGDLESGMGCPSADSQLVVYQPLGSTELQVRKKVWYDALLTNDYIFYGNSEDEIARTLDRNYNSYQSIYQHFITESPDISSNCVFESKANTQEAYVKCNPSKAIANPVIGFYVNAVQAGINIPSSTPSLGTTQVSEIEAASSQTLKQTVSNIGEEQDSYTLTVEPKNIRSSVQTSAIRFDLKAGEVKIVEVPIQANGISDTFNIIMTSVNDPTKTVSKEQKITINPLCSIPKPGNAYVKRYTAELGCVWVCPNQYLEDVDAACNPITRYDRCIERNENNSCVKRITYGEQLHCSGIGQMLKTNEYADGINSGKIIKFVAQEIQGKEFVGVPYCDHFNIFGYSDAPVIFSPQSSVVEANLGSVPSVTPEVGEELVVPTSLTPTNNGLYIWIGIGLIGTIIVVYLIKKR